MIGTPFISEDEITQRKVDKINKKPWEQEVRDEKGRKRLHGAFTGGFSAGYFNTVGTKEGWTASQFRSSRADKNTIQPIKSKKQDVMDFMDEEDIKEQIGENGITGKDVNRDYYFQTLNQKNIKNMNDLEETSVINDINSNSFKEFIPQFNNMIGNMLMKESGFIEAEYQLNAQNFYLNYNGVYNNNLINNKNKYYTGRLEFKDDYYGVGYIPLIEDEIFTGKKANEISNQKNIIRMDKFEDDEEYGYYTNTRADKEKEKYSFEILDENYLNDKDRELKRKRIRERIEADMEKTALKFVKSEKSLHSVENLEFKMPVLPKDYDPFNLENINSIKNKEKYDIESEINKLNKKNNIDGISHQKDNKRLDHIKLDANKRSQLLDLELEINPTTNPNPNNNLPESKNPYLQSKFTKAEVYDFKSQNENKLLYNPKKDINENTNNIKTTPSTYEQFNNFFHLKVEIPFKDDISKIARFAKFVAEKEGLILSDSTYNQKNNLMSASDSKIERELFEKSYKEELRLRKEEQNKKNEIKNPQLSESELIKDRIEKIKNREVKREKITWKPEKTLCKRFRLKDPFENKINSVISNATSSNSVREDTNITFKKGEVKYTMSNLQYQLFKQENPNYKLLSDKSGNVDPVKDFKVVNNEQNVFNIVNAKTDVNLFEEIFGD